MAEAVIAARAADAVRPLVVEAVSKSFGGLQALEGVSLDLAEGERRAIIGANGAGKTTLFHLISGIHQPTTGRIYLFGRDVTRMSIHGRATLGLARTFQITNLFPSLTVLENVLLAIQSHEPHRFVIHRMMGSYKAQHAAAHELLEQWGLRAKADTEVRHLSYGEQRELEIIMALAQKPKLLLLDEPTSGLSSAETASVTRMIQSLSREITVLLIEHDMDVVFDLVERITVLHLGRLVADGKPDEIRRDQRVQEIYLGVQTS